MVKMVASYERMEDNKKRMEEALNLPEALNKTSSPKSKPSPSKPRIIQKELVVVRRSSRVAKLPSPVYKEVLIDKYRDYSKRVYASDEAREEAWEKADKLLSDLNSAHPTFVKSMLQSHVTGGFWLVYIIRVNDPSEEGEQLSELRLEIGASKINLDHGAKRCTLIRKHIIVSSEHPA